MGDLSFNTIFWCTSRLISPLPLCSNCLRLRKKMKNKNLCVTKKKNGGCFSCCRRPVASGWTDQLVTQRLSVQHQPLDNYFQLQGDCTGHLVGYNPSPENHGGWTNCSHRQITVILFINTDRLPTRCDQSESGCASESSVTGFFATEDSAGCFWLYSCYICFTKS